MGVSSSNLLRSTSFGDIAQLARASALQAEGRRFDSVYLHFEASESSEASFFVSMPAMRGGRELRRVIGKPCIPRLLTLVV